MKRILVLLLAIGLILGLSATAWAAGESIDATGPASVAWDEDITIQVAISGLETKDYTLSCSNMPNSPIIVNTNGSQSFTTNASNFSAGTTVVFEATLNDGSNDLKDSWSVNIGAKPLSSDNFLTYINIPGVGSKNGPPESGFTFTAPSSVASIAVNTISTTISTGASAQICDGGGTPINNNGSINLGAVGAETNTNFSVKVTAEDNGTPRTYTFTINRPASLNTASALTSISLTPASSVSSISSPVAGSTNSFGTVANSVPSVSFNIATSSGATYAVYGNTTASGTPINSLNLSEGVASSFSVKVTSQSGTNNSTYIFTVTRLADTTTTLVNSVTLRSGSASGTQVGTAIGTITTANLSSSRSIQIPASLRSTTTFYAVVALPSGNISNATFSGTGVSSSYSGNTVTLSIPSTTNSATLTLTVAGNSIPITITRETNATILKSVSFTYSSTVLGSLTNLSGTSTQTLNLNTTATSATLKWELADGATFSSAKWGSTNLSSANASGYSAGLPTSGSTALVITATASNGSLYTATINVSRSATAVNTLSSLYIKSSATNSTNSGYLFSTSPSSFNSNTLEYKVYVNDDTDVVYVYPTPTSTSSTVDVTGNYSKCTDRYSNYGYFQVDLRSGSNSIQVKVTGNGTTTYTLTIEREENVVPNASLDSLYVSKSSTSYTGSNRYSLDPSFAYNKTKYDVDLAKSVTEVYLHFTTNRSNASVSVSGASKVSDGVYKATLSTNKTKTVTITVSYSNDETKYTINLNNGNASTHAQLSNIRVAERESNSSSYQYTVLPDFDSSLTDYVVLIPYESSGNYAYVQATLDDDDDELRVDGYTVNSGDWTQISITRGKSVSVPIKVTDEDDNTTTYSLQIVAAKNNASDDAELDSLSLRTSSSSSSALSLSPTFSHNTTKYSVANVANSTSTLRVYAETSDSGAWVIVNNVLMTGSYEEVDLDEGSNTIEVVVYAADCETSKTYTITVNRGAEGGSDSTLYNLEARYGTSDGQTLNLYPAFARNITTYKINVDGSVAQIAFKPTSTDETATIKIMGKDEISGQWTSYNALSSGSNNFLIIVTSGDGRNNSYYTVTVERGLSVVVSGQKLRVNGTDVTCAAYNINGNNYFKLRDIAYALRGTTKNFDVGYNSVTRVVSMTSGKNYSIIGGEMKRPVAPGKYQLSNQTVLKDGSSVNLTAYNVDGNNYFMLREIGQLFNFGVTFDSTSGTVMIDSNSAYVPE